MITPLRALLLNAFLAALSALEGRSATLTVTNTSASGPGSLQQAILDANSASGLDTIVFQIPGTGVRTIAPISAFPTITDPVVIDGTTQPGFVDTPLIEINGANAGTSADGLLLRTTNSVVRGLVINRFGGAGIHLQAPGSANFIQGNFIGTDPGGSLSRGNGTSPAAAGGVWVDGSPGNFIGGPDPAHRNLISANGGSGIYLFNCSGNTVQGNLVGTTLAGTAALGNTSQGVSLYNSSSNVIGGTSPAARNIISGNGGAGVFLYGLLTTGNLVQGNYIGTQTNGTLSLPNAVDGIRLNGARANTIGGTSAGAGNLISGNSQGGLVLHGSGTDNNLVQGNLIGTDASGKLPLGNVYSGVIITAGTNNLFGGTSASARNVISANLQSGLYFTTNAAANLVQGNFIGLDATGTNGLGNLANGISIDGASFNIIGGTTTGARNVISGNTCYGLDIYSFPATANLVQGNYIGPNALGLAAVANKLCGIHIKAPGNIIGGGAGNLISGNLEDGIFLDGAGAAQNVVQGNLIGTTASGTAGLGNRRGGIGISGAPANTIGGTTASDGNTISANTEAGVWLLTSGATGNLIRGNRIGTDLTGTLGLGNTHEGIYLERAPTNTIGGTDPGAGNLISGNKTRGVFLVNAPGNLIQGNLIGTRIDGAAALGNVFHAIECEAGACNNTVGGTGGAGNVIAFAQTVYAGVRIRPGSTNNAILGNSIFSNAALGIDLGNAGINANIACGGGSGANMAQNYPVLAEAVTGNGTGIRGVLNSRPNSSFALQFFASPAGDSSGCGEGQIYLGQANLSTGPNCTNSFVVSFPASVPAGYAIAATATDSANNTSEFSAWIAATPAPVLSVASLPGGSQVRLSWTNTNPSFVLKQTDNLTPTILWTTVTNIPALVGGQYVVTLPSSTGKRFFRLSFE